jgi:hypothetical protein
MAKRRKEDGNEDKKEEDEADGEPSKYKAGVGKKTRGTVVSYIGGIGDIVFLGELDVTSGADPADCVNNNTDWFRGLHFRCGRTTELQRLKYPLKKENIDQKSMFSKSMIMEELANEKEKTVFGATTGRSLI